MLQIYAPYVEQTTVSAEYFVPSPATFSARMEALKEKFPVLVFEEEGEILGYATSRPPSSAVPFRGTAISPSMCVGMPAVAGIGTGLEGGRVPASQRELGYRRIYALVTGENGASIEFHKRMGYRITAEFPEALFKQGRWMSLIWLEKEVNAPNAPPPSRARSPRFPRTFGRN